MPGKGCARGRLCLPCSPGAQQLPLLTPPATVAGPAGPARPLSSSRDPAVPVGGAVLAAGVPSAQGWLEEAELCGQCAETPVRAGQY